MASVGSEEEDNFINSLGSNFYLGGSDSAQEGTWVWSDGTAWTYVNWGSGAPNNENNDENCIIGNWFERGHWQDGTCDRTGWWVVGYACEKKIEGPGVTSAYPYFE